MSQTNIKKTTFVLFLLRVFRMSLSMVTLIFSAKYFGVSLERDMWVLVSTFLATIGAALWGPINETFRAKFIFLKEQEGESSAISKTLSLIKFIVIGTTSISIIILIFVRPISCVMLSEASFSKASFFISLLLVMLPTLLVNQLTSLGICLLNAYDIYYVPEYVGVISSLINVLIIILLTPIIGIYSLVASQYIAILLLLFVVYHYLKKTPFNFNKALKFNFKDVKIFMVFALPFFFPYFVGQINILAEKWIANSLGEGYVSTLDYARQFTQVLQSVMSSVLTTIMVPMLAKFFAQKDTASFINTVKENFVICFVIMSLTIPFLIGSTRPLCEIFFMHGKVSLEALSTIVNLTRLYGIALIGVILYLIFGLILLSSNEGKKYAFWGIFAQFVVLLLNITFSSYLGIYIFPISLGIGHLIVAIILSFFLKIEGKRHIYLKIIKYTIILCLISLGLYVFNLKPLFENPILQMFINSFILIFLFLIFANFLDINLRLYKRKIINKILLKIHG